MTASTPPPSWDVVVPLLSHGSRKDWFRCTVSDGKVVVTPPAEPFVLTADKLGEVRAALREAGAWALRRSQ